MSYADQVFRANCLDILQSGVRDDDLTVRPHWADGTPAHTIKKFGLVNRYDLQKEFPILTLRRTYLKSAVDELLWIWQKKSNNVHDLSSHIWDSWADETGSIGKAYGYQLGVKHQYKEGLFDQVDRVLYDLKHNPASRRILTNLYNFEDLHEMHLYPCAYSMTFNVSNGTLNAILNQRSQDMLAANNWNVCQYALSTSSPTRTFTTVTFPSSSGCSQSPSIPPPPSVLTPPSRIFTPSRPTASISRVTNTVPLKKRSPSPSDASLPDKKHFRKSGASQI